MDIVAAIHGRRTVHDYSDRPIAREQVETMLEAAVRAPNHKLTNPWEFYVIGGRPKEYLAQLRGRLKSEKAGDPDSPQAKRSYERAYGEMATVPWAILVCQRLAEDPVRREEDLLSVGCAIQNLMLAAHSMGIGTFWGTGPLLNHPETFRVLSIPEGHRGVGLVFVGYPAHPVEARARDPITEHVRFVTELPPDRA